MLIAQVAHEVRNPLAGIRSTVQLWQRLPDESRTPESLQAVVAAVDRLDALLSDLLYFSRAENTDRQSVDLNGVVRETLDLLRHRRRSRTWRYLFNSILIYRKSGVRHERFDRLFSTLRPTHCK